MPLSEGRAANCPEQYRVIHRDCELRICGELEEIKAIDGVLGQVS